MPDPRLKGFSVVEVADLPEYPIPVGVRLEGHGWFQFHHAWWRASDFRRRAEADVRGIFIDLLCAAQDEDPVGTLPCEPGALAWVARMPSEADWNRIMQREVNPLYGWERCRVSDGRVRLFHPRLLEVTQSAARSKVEASARRAADRERKRLAELGRKILQAGGSERMVRDEAFVARLDHKLTEMLGAGVNRTVDRVREALEALD